MLGVNKTSRRAEAPANPASGERTKDGWVYRLKGGRIWQQKGTAVQEDKAVSLKKCRHTFHSRCLASWFLVERYDCPVCREVYWGVRRPEPAYYGAQHGRHLVDGAQPGLTGERGTGSRGSQIRYSAWGVLV